MNGAYLIYKEVCLNDNIGYKNMYCIVGCRDKLKIINSLVIDFKGNLDKLYERVVYYDSALDLKKAWKAMKYVVYESIEEKEISKKFSLCQM
ncbi:MAG: hypothetical protein IJZ36_02625, partial [Bacilli bacterium]|nr:hypothetical protein [Bacilli bacterium]